MIRRIFLLSLVASLFSSCAGGGRGGRVRSPYCCLVDPAQGSLLVEDSPAFRNSLDSWVTKNAAHLSIKGGAKPRFILLYVGKELTIKDKMPLSDQASPTAPHRLTGEEVRNLRSCFAGGRSVQIDWAGNRVR